MARPVFAFQLIRDTEIERTLRAYSDPVFASQGLVPENIRMFLVQDDAINAFVMGGSNVFINTGLILKTEDPLMLIGVIAHETGHISGGHLVRTGNEVDKLTKTSLMGYLLGAAAIAGGAGDVGMAVISANQNIAMRNMFRFTRGNEQAADQAALKSLDALGLSASGMVRMFDVLRHQESRAIGVQDPYLRSHPLSKDRIMHMRNHLEASKIPEDQVPEAFAEMHQRMVAKLEGFLDDPYLVLKRYPEDDESLKARYARAVAHYRLANTDAAVGEMDALIAQKPMDGFFYELKGQIQFEGGDIEGAGKSYEKAVSLLPDAPLILTELGRVLMANKDAPPEDIKRAITHLEKAQLLERENPVTWRLLATAYGKDDQKALSHIALAEEGLLLSKPDQMLQQLTLAEPYVWAGSASALRVEDLKRAAIELQREMEKNGASFVTDELR